MMDSIDLRLIESRLLAALEEDVGRGDVTSRLTIPESERALGRYVSKQALVVSGLPVAAELARLCDPSLEFRSASEDGDRVEDGALLAEVRGSARSILVLERTSLNFLQRMSGIATATRAYVARVRGTRASIIDTRKTAPGLRVLDKYAVRCGGGANHRAGLDDGILIKNNHLAFYSRVRDALAEAAARNAGRMKIEVEVRSLDQVREAIEGGADIILLDNFTPEETRRAAILVAGRIPLESSGGITLENVRDFAEAGVDYISVGALTHSVVAADMHLQVVPGGR